MFNEEIHKSLRLIEQGKNTDSLKLESFLKQISDESSLKRHRPSKEVESDLTPEIHQLLSKESKNLYKKLKSSNIKPRKKKLRRLSGVNASEKDTKRIRRKLKGHAHLARALEGQKLLEKTFVDPVLDYEGVKSINATSRLLKRYKKSLERDKHEREEELRAARDSIPIKFMFQRNLDAFCAEKGIAVIDATFQRMITNYKIQVMELWKYFLDKAREHERFVATNLLLRVTRGFLARVFCQNKRQELELQSERRLKVIKFRVIYRKTQAVKIQMCFRRYCVAKLTKERRDRINAAIYIQKSYRLFKARLSDILELLHEKLRQKSAVVIQKRQRGIQGRIKFRRKFQERKIQLRTKLLLDPIAAIALNFELSGAAFMIQRHVKFRIRRRKGRELRHHMLIDRSARRIQNCCRTFIARIHFTRVLRELRADVPVRRKAAIMIQRCFRGAQCRWQFRSWLAQEQRRRREERKAAKLLKMSRRRNVIVQSKNKSKITAFGKVFGKKVADDLIQSDSAKKIQSVWRGFIDRKLVKRLRHEERLRQAELQRIRCMNAAITIQRVYRGRCGRRIARQQKEWSKALRIQTIYRGYVARVKYRELINLRDAVLTIQRLFRTNFARNFRKYMQHRRHMEVWASVSIQRICKGALSRIRLVARLETSRLSAEVEAAGEAYNAVYHLRAIDTLILRSLQGTLKDSTQNPFNRKRIFFPVIQTIFAQYTTAAVGKKKTEMTGPKFTSIFKESGRIVGGKCTQQQLDLLFTQLKSKKGGLGYDDFVDAFVQASALLFPRQPRAGRVTGKDVKVVKFVRESLMKRKAMRKALTLPLEAYAASWIKSSASFLQRVHQDRKARLRALEIAQAHREERKARRENAAATKLQQLYRQRLAKRYFAETMKSVFKKYIDAETGLPYWVNPRTGFSTWEKPLCFGDDDVFQEAIPLPDQDTNFTEPCSNCVVSSAQAYCYQCQDFFCPYCCDSFHEKGNNATHQFCQIKVCDLCSFQVASGHCQDCNECFCDNCWYHTHHKGAMSTHSIKDLVEKCTECQNTRSVRSFCHSCNRNLCNVCSKYHGNCYIEALSLKTLEMVEQFEKDRRIYLADPANLAKMKHEKRINAMATRIQRRWRTRSACRVAMLEMAELKEKKQEEWRIKTQDQKKKKRLKYLAKDAFGNAEQLESDTPVDVAIKRLNILARLKMEKKARAHDLSLYDLVAQGIPLPGRLNLSKGKETVETTGDGTKLLKLGGKIRIHDKVYDLHKQLKAHSDYLILAEPYPGESEIMVQAYAVEIVVEEGDIEVEKKQVPSENVLETNQVATEEEYTEQPSEEAEYPAQDYDKAAEYTADPSGEDYTQQGYEPAYAEYPEAEGGYDYSGYTEHEGVYAEEPYETTGGEYAEVYETHEAAVNEYAEPEGVYEAEYAEAYENNGTNGDEYTEPEGAYEAEYAEAYETAVSNGDEYAGYTEGVYEATGEEYAPVYETAVSNGDEYAGYTEGVYEATGEEYAEAYETEVTNDDEYTEPEGVYETDYTGAYETTETNGDEYTDEYAGYTGAEGVYEAEYAEAYKTNETEVTINGGEYAEPEGVYEAEYAGAYETTEAVVTNGDEYTDEYTGYTEPEGVYDAEYAEAYETQVEYAEAEGVTGEEYNDIYREEGVYEEATGEDYGYEDYAEGAGEEYAQVEGFYDENGAGQVSEYTEEYAEGYYEGGEVAAALPENWSEVYDEDSGYSYYYNSVTGESSWEYPQ